MTPTPRGRAERLALAACWLALIFSPSGANGDDEADRRVMERFQSVLERSPRRGTALDRVYGYHVERGTLDALVKAYRDRAEADPKDGSSRMLIGLIESQRGRDSAAVASFREAERLRPEDALPSYYLGQALVMVGQPGEAADAFERALARKPGRADLLDIFQALGRVHQRARRDDRAMAVWTRMEAMFPDDPKVREQIASALADEARYEPALARYEAMAASARDPIRRLGYRIEAADLKARLGRKADALREYEGLLGSVDPESWVGREVRRKVEDVFLHSEDQAGLATYYEAWIGRTPEDVEAMARLGKCLAAQGRSAEARTWLERALKLAPTRKALRLALVEQLAQEKKFAEAAAQYESMARSEPNNPDLVRDWGKMVLRDTARPEADRKQAASAVWRKLVDARPDDPSTLAQVADLHRQAGLVDEAVALLRKAVAIAPDAPQYREYLGELYQSLKRPDDALAAWRGIAEGPRRDPKNLGRLGEVLAGFGFKAEAAASLAEAAGLDPDAFDLRVRLADLLLGLRRFDEAGARLDEADRLADSDERRDEVFERRVALDEAADRLPKRLEALRKEVAGAHSNDPTAWRRLARHAEAARQPAEAVLAAEKAVALAPDSIPALTLLARLRESVGRLGESAEASRRLASIDRRSRAEHLTAVARLEARLGRRDEALAAARDLLAASPGNPDTARFFADLCFQLGQVDQGIDALARAARANEVDPKPTVALAEALSNEFRTEEAIEQYWRAFDRTVDLDGRLGLVARLADLHLRRNQVDRLIARLDRMGLDEGKRREAALYLAQAQAAIGDFGTARVQLEGLLAASPRDTALLKQLAKLAEDEGDLPAAVKYQKQLLEVAPSDEAGYRLAQLALQSGEFDVAEAVWSRASAADPDVARVLMALDAMTRYGKHEAVLATTSRLLRKNPGQWEILDREARALIALDRFDEAATRFNALLALRRDDEDPAADVKARRKGSPTAGVKTIVTTLNMDRTGARYRLQAATQIRTLYRLDTEGAQAPSSLIFMPQDFGQARIDALGGQLFRARRDGDEAGWLARRRQDRAKAPGDLRALWDDVYVAMIRLDYREIYESARALARASGRDPSADYLLLYGLLARNSPPGVRVAIQGAPDGSPPLPPADLDLVRDAYLSLARTAPSTLYSVMETAVQAELKKAGRLGELDATYRELMASARDLGTYQAAASMAAARGDLDALRSLSATFFRIPPGSRPAPYPNQPYYLRGPQGTIPIPADFEARAMRLKADAKAYPEILRLLDDELAASRTPARVAERARANRTSGQSSTTTPIYPDYASDGRGMASFDFPTAGAYLDHNDLTLLRNAFGLFNRDKRIGELKGHLRAAAQADPSVPARMALASILWWSGDRDEAVTELGKAVASSPDDAELKLTMADLRAKRREPDEALALLDSIEAPDQDLTRRRELMAMRMAAQANRTDRAALAAERLFGLRLDNATQIELAGQMRQLGMNDLADAVLARTRRRVGNDTEALLALMDQYRKKGDTEVAAQIAFQILRRSPGGRLAGRVADPDDPARRQALQVLAGSGKLAEMIGRVEAQRKLSPDSTPILQTLAVYYRAAGQADKLKEVSAAMARLRPDDVASRLQVAAQLVQAGDTAGALDIYRDAFKKDRARFSAESRNIISIYQQAGKVDDLLRLIDELGAKVSTSSYPLTGLITSLLVKPNRVERGMALLRKTWDAFPADRVNILSNVAYTDAFWERPEAIVYAREGTLAAAVYPLSNRPIWIGVDTIWPRALANDRADTPSARLLDDGARQGTLEALAVDFEGANRDHPRWLAGKAFLGMIRLRQGRVDEGRRLIEVAMADPIAAPIPYETLVLIAQELKDIPETRSIALACYDRASLDPTAWMYLSIHPAGNAARQLALLHVKEGRPDMARAVLARAVVDLKTALDVTANPNAAQRKLACLDAFAAASAEIGDPVGALRIDANLLDSVDTITLAKGYVLPPLLRIESVDALIARARDRVSKVLGGLDPATLAPTLRALVDPGSGRPPDLLMVVHPHEVDRASVESLFVTASGQAAREPASIAKLRGDLDTMAKARPDDLEVEIGAALAAVAGAEPGSATVAEAAARLDRLASAHPPGPLSEGTKPNARQRDEAKRWLGLWLVARACWAHESTREAGDKLAALALEGARRQLDPLMALAMLREWGRWALDRGDRATAEARWSGLLDLILEGTRPGPSARARMPVPTLERFDQAFGLARLAAEHGMSDLSTRAIRDALRGGPPVAPTPTPTRVGAATAEPPPDPVAVAVGSALVAIDGRWARMGLSPIQAYETIRDAVMPPSRPAEVFPFDDPAHPGEVGRLLARRAVEAGRVADLRDRIAGRKARPAAKGLLDLLDEAEKGVRRE